jgi:type I restriction enzyme, S subunit
MIRPMKDSGVEWIGEIPEHWDITKLKNEIRFVNGYAFDSSDLSIEKEGYPVIRIGDFTNAGIDIDSANRVTKEIPSISNYQINNDDILIAMSGGTVGKLAYVKEIAEKAYINQRVGIIRAEKSKFIYHYLNSGEFLKYIFLLASGTAQPNISTVNIKIFHITCPPEEEHQKITDFLDEKTVQIDSIIDNTKQSITEFKKYKQALITETVTKGLNPNVKMKDSGIEWIGEIPENYTVVQTKYISQIRRGASPRPIEKYMSDNGEGHSWIRIGDSTPGEKYITSTKLKVTDEGAKKSVRVNPGDLIMSNSMSIGRSYICGISGYIHDGWLAFSFNDNKVDGEWLSYVLNASISFLESLALGTTVSNLNIDRVKSLKIPFCDKRTQQQIVAFLDEKCTHIDNLIADKEKLIGEFEDYKKALIYEYVTGKKEVE